MREIKVESRSTRSVRVQLDVAQPSDRALDHLQDGARRTGYRATQVRRAFINADRGVAPAPLGRVVKGGRAAGVRLRLILGLLWQGGGGDERHRVTFPARAWAEMFDLDDPAGAGQRRIRSALKWLEDAGLISVGRERGRPLAVTLRSEDGSGQKYIAPVKAAKDPATGKLPPRDWSVRLPPSFWTNGWILALSTPALALLLVMLDMKRKDRRQSWVSPEKARQRYGLSEDTWTRGIAELEAHGLVSVGRQPVDDTLRWRRVRNNYELHIGRLDNQPRWAPRQ